MEREERFKHARFKRAYEHAEEMLEIYKQIPSGTFASMAIANDIRLYKAGDRSDALLESMEGIQ